MMRSQTVITASLCGTTCVPQADVFSYGMLLWELFHVARPFEKLSARQVVREVQSTKRPRISLPPALEAFGGVITVCWAQAAADRPEMADVLDQLQPGSEAESF